MKPHQKRNRNIFKRAEDLLIKRGICGDKEIEERFIKHFCNKLVADDAQGYGDAERTLSLLEDDSNLTDSSILNKNFRCELIDLISDKLSKDDIFPKLFREIIKINGKGVGIGEMTLPLILSNYRYSTECDGVFDGNKKVELKKNGGSLKPLATGNTHKGLVDELSDRIFKGSPPGFTGKLFKKHLNVIKEIGHRDKSLIKKAYREFFTKLWPGIDCTGLLKDIDNDVWQYENAFRESVGKHVLPIYQKIDGWNNIMFINMKTEVVVNIKDTKDVDSLGLRFSPKFKRGNDTQAIADGYVNVSIIPNQPKVMF